MISVLHVSDLHFGQPAIPEQIEAIDAMVQRERYDVVAVSGDVTQRARPGEFQRAHAFLRDAARVSRTIVVPGNHDIKWWRDPLGLGVTRAPYASYRRYIAPELEPVLRIPGATFVGWNTAHGVQPYTLTWNPRDIGVVGDLAESQVAHARSVFADSTPTDLRIIVMHHNPLKGNLSERHGLVHTRRALDAFAELEVDAVLCGHDHQEAIRYVEHPRRGTVVSTAGTVSDRSRGGRPNSLNTLTLGPAEIVVRTCIWSAREAAFLEGPVKRFAR